ncbi:MAG: hypothetical protein HY898_04155 [Deltaproteobacteria bacterium]|nr:hypothetical protein [Deltaproteobacteria bacterium]
MTGRTLGLSGFAARLAVAALVASGVGCSDSNSEPSPGGAFLSEMCSLLAPCCAEAGVQSNPGMCAQAYSAMLGSAVYNAQAGEECLTALRTATSNGTVCNMSAMSNPACDRAFSKGGGGGTRKPGETCSEDSDCAAQSAGDVQCLHGYDSTTNSNTETCTNVLEGKAGDTPCVGTRDGSITMYSTGSGTAPAVGYLCDKAAGITCDYATHACKPLGNIGDACNYSDSDCVDAAWCNTKDKKCAARVGAGSPCTTSKSECDVTTYCNESKVCTTLVANGQPCTTSDQCKSHSCTNGACKATVDFGLMFVCQT